MSTFHPPPPYTPEQLAALYPSGLELRQVQVIFRHGERTPVNPRLQNAGVPPYWSYCHAACRFTAAILGSHGEWDELEFQRRLETFGPNGKAVPATGPGGEIDGVCIHGELTDRGRETTHALGLRLRRLYVKQLGFLPEKLADPSEYYLRATPIVRALESLHEVFTGLYPTPYRHVGIPPPIIVTRTAADENLFPNEANCRRFSMLARAFADDAAKRWNHSPEMDFLNEKIGKWMPEGQRVAVDSHPRLSGLQDTVNSTLAHGPEVRLPDVFYEPQVRRIMNDINVYEWYRGYKVSHEFRKLGVGSILNDIKNRAVSVARGDEKAVKLALMGCHDTTLAGILASLGAFDDQWPPFTSNIAIETFRVIDHRRSFWERVTGSNPEKGWYVRLRYNERPVVVSACKKPGKHLEGKTSFCTMEAFKETIEKFAPKDWKRECLMNMDKPGLPPVEPVD
ncbi:histidine phosphatase superfamily [Sphaerosporella brunnea]|uniref:3-phytase n=1 Tax=Sphaerosporella brunnea TaxID=1250544 RepID=A0A5J5EFG3_9PEZI|nr:histidine phosphatase superfamily [Sphaerosporella brunnea]